MLDFGFVVLSYMQIDQLNLHNLTGNMLLLFHTSFLELHCYKCCFTAVSDKKIKGAMGMITSVPTVWAGTSRLGN